tara:strand:- start:3843 stop:4223 length:381 start_codon:yes stop_codon:yes gene_type:complete
MEIYIILTLIFITFIAISVIAYGRAKALKQYAILKSDYQKLLSHKKSSEVRLGQISEQLAPFLDLFPYDPKKVQFLGNPIDYIYFGEDKVAIIEVKSGNARLSKKQKAIKALVLKGKVEWKEIRIK